MVDEAENLKKKVSELEQIINLGIDASKHATDLQNVDTKGAINQILVQVKDILHFNCAEFFLITDENKKVLAPGKIENILNERYLWWITGVGYDEGYLKIVETFFKQILTMPRGPPRSIFIKDFNYEPLIVYDDYQYIKKLETENRLCTEYYELTKKQYETEQDPKNFPRGGYSEYIYQIYIPTVREINNTKEMFGLVIVDTPLDIDLHQKISDEKMEQVLKTVQLIQTPILIRCYADELNQKNKSLETALETETQLRDKLVQTEKRALLSNAVGDFSHVVNGIVGSTSSGINLMRRYLDKGEVEKAKEKLDMLERGTDKLKQYSKRLSMIATAGRKDYERANINSVIDRLVQTYQEQLTSKNINLQLELDQNIKEIKQKDLMMVVDNLLSNSIRAVEQRKGIERDYAGKITIKTELKDKYIFLSVEDNGIGIKEENLSKVFKESFTTKPKSEGVGGYGLITVAGICEENHAEYNLESKINVGTKFVMQLQIEKAL